MLSYIYYVILCFLLDAQQVSWHVDSTRELLWHRTDLIDGCERAGTAAAVGVGQRRSAGGGADVQPRPADRCHRVFGQ